MAAVKNNCYSERFVFFFFFPPSCIYIQYCILLYFSLVFQRKPSCFSGFFIGLLIF